MDPTRPKLDPFALCTTFTIGARVVTSKGNNIYDYYCCSTTQATTGKQQLSFCNLPAALSVGVGN